MRLSSPFRSPNVLSLLRKRSRQLIHPAAPLRSLREKAPSTAAGAPRLLRIFAGLGAVALLSTSAAAEPKGEATGGSYPLACHYHGADFDRHEHCARRKGAMVRIAPSHTTGLRFQDGLAEVAISGIGWLWARPDGLALPVFMLDNGPDPFEQGLVRARHGGKVAFYDRHLRLVLATPYDWSFPFNADGAALVCTGCRSDGLEPSSMIGGKWGLIDRQGRLLMPLSEGEAAADRYFARQ